MQGKFTDLTGNRYGKLIVLKIVTHDSPHTWYLCRCDCGKEFEVVGYSLTRSKHNTKSCGCEHCRTRYKIHNLSNKRPYRIWRGMKGRCLDKNNKDYLRYGGRGITVCDKWITFKGFWEDMRDGYSENLSIDRIDTNGNYEPSNCRWATSTEQANNRRSNVTVEINGQSKTISQWAIESKLSREVISYRYRKMGLIGADLIAPLQRKRA